MMSVIKRIDTALPNALASATAAFACLLLFAFINPAGAQSAGDLTSYKIGPGDRLAVVVFGQAELSGDFVIDGAGNVAFPLVGNVPLKDLNLAEAKNLITKRLESGLLSRPNVSVRLAEPRPIQVIGDVRTPGVYPYLYGGIIKTAIAQAGGTLVAAEETPGAAIADFLQADERVRVLTGLRRSLLIREARIIAQRDGRKTFEVSPEILGLDDPADVERLMQQEKETLLSQVEAHEKQIEVIGAQRPQFEQELRALQGQVESEKKQMSLVSQQIETYDRLVKQGLGRANSQIEYQLAEASRQTNIWRLDGDQSRIRNQIVDLDIRIHDLRAANQRLLQTELQDARSRLHETEISLASAREIREARLQDAGGVGASEAKYSYTISRTRSGRVETITGTADTFLEPGDIVEIKRSLPERTRIVKAIN